MFPHQHSSQVYFRPEHAPRNHLKISGRSRQEDEHTGAAVPAVTSPSALALVSSAGSISGDTPLRSSYRSETLSDQKASHSQDGHGILQWYVDVTPAKSQQF